MTAAQRAQQNNRHADGRYAEGQLADPGTDIGLAELGQPKRSPHTGIDVSKAANPYWADDELDKSWRDETGRVFTMREDIEAGKYAGKYRYHDPVNGWRYILEHADGGGRGTPVTRTLYDAYTGPDSTPPSQVTYERWLSKQKAAEKARSDLDPVKAATLQGEADQILAQYEAETAAERAAKPAADDALKNSGAGR